MPKLTGCGKADRSTLHGMSTAEHDKVVSRTRGVKVEIGVGPHGGNLVSNNPFASILQQKFLHANPEKVGGKEKLKEWDAATDFSKLPKKAKK